MRISPASLQLDLGDTPVYAILQADGSATVIAPPPPIPGPRSSHSRDALAGASGPIAAFTTRTNRPTTGQPA